MRRFLGGVLAGAAGVLLLGRWLKERRVLSERRQGWSRVRNVWSPVVYPLPGPPPKEGEGVVSVGVDETPEVRVETGVRLRPDGVVEVLWCSAVDRRTEGCVKDGTFDLGEDDHGLLCEDHSCFTVPGRDKVIFDDTLGPTGGIDEDEEESCQDLSAEGMACMRIKKSVINTLDSFQPTVKLLRYMSNFINQQLDDLDPEINKAEVDCGEEG